MASNLSRLVTEWDSFEEQHPDASIEDFCRYFLIQQREKTQQGNFIGGHTPPDTNAILMKVLGRIGMIFMIYRTIALEETELGSPEGFPFLNTLAHLGECRKTDVINQNLIELSTGIDILTRLRVQGLITERPDLVDRRSKLVSVTPEGQRVLYQCYAKMRVIGTVLFDGMTEDEKKLCIQLLKNIEIKHSKLISESKGKGFEDLVKLSGVEV